MLKLLHLLKVYHPLFVKPGNPHLKIKMDGPLQIFIAEMDLKYDDLNLQEKFATIFFSDSEAD